MAINELSRNRSERLAGAIRRRCELLWANESFFAVVLTFVFLCLALAGVLHHAIWRDEMYFWSLAKDSTSFLDLCSNARYVNFHYLLWPVLLYPLTRFTHDPAAAQVLHVLLAASVVWIVTRHAPFGRLARALFAFGYFPFFEFCLITRQYVLIELGVFLFCLLYPRRHDRLVRIALLFVAMMNVNRYGLLVAAGLGGVLALEFILEPETRARWLEKKRSLFLSAGLVLLGLLLVVAQEAVKHQLSGISKPNIMSISNVSDTLNGMLRAYMPLPGGFPHWPRWYWGTNYLLDTPGWSAANGLAAVVSIGLIAFSLYLVWPSWKIRVLYAWGMGMMLLVSLIRWSGLRHVGFLVMLLIASLWLTRRTEAVLPVAPKSAVLQRRTTAANWFLMILFLVQAVAGVYVYSADHVRPYSAAKQAARFIVDQGLSRLTIAGHSFQRISTLAGLLDKPIYYPELDRYGSYWHDGDDHNIPLETCFPKVLELARSQGAILLALSQPLQANRNGVVEPLRELRLTLDGRVVPPTQPHPFPTLTLTAIAFFPDCVIDEYFFLYLVKLDQS